MLPLYIFLTLSGVGYYLSNTKRKQEKNIEVSENDLANVYKQKMMKIVQKMEQEKADKVVSDFHKNNNAAKNSENAKPSFVSELSGQTIENFAHNNMTPFFRGNHSYEDYNKDGFINKLEIATGIIPFYRPKEAIPTMFKPEENIQEIAGNKVSLEKEQSYYLKSRTRNGEKPFQEQRVGPGLGKDDDPLGGTGGFNASMLNRETFLGRYKDASELRVETNPKTTYESRQVDGVKEILYNSDNLGQVCKNRPELEVEHGHERLFKTTGAFRGHENYPEYIVRDTDKQLFAKEYVGIAGDKSQQQYVDGDYQFYNINQLSDFGVRNATLNDYGKGADFDYGKSNIVIYTNERTETTCKTHTTNMTTYVKALTAPLLDILRASNKEYFVQNPRVNGIVGTSIHKKMTVYDPNDIARTTIKETLIHDTVKNNLTGNEKGQVYQMDDARTTTRETLEQQYHANMQGPDKSYVYDPEDVARTTMKETIIDDQREFGNINAREGEGLGYLTNDATMRYTSRQEAFTEYDGIVDGEKMGGGTGYKTAPTDLKKTQKAYISNNDYYGSGYDYLNKPTQQNNYRNVRPSDAKEKTLIRPPRMGSSVKLMAGKDTVKPTQLRNNCLSQQAPRETNNHGNIRQVIPDKSFINQTQCRDDNDKNVYRDMLDIKATDILGNNPLAISITDNL